MKKLMVGVAITASLVLSLVSLPQAQSSTSITCEGSGPFYFFIAGSGEAEISCLDMDTPYSTRDDTLTIGGTSYMGMQYANYLTVDRLMIVNNGAVWFEQSYFDGSGDLGYFGTFLGTDEMGILCTSGFFAGALAETNFSIIQYAGKDNPNINTSVAITPLNDVTEGLGSSQMAVTLYDDWIYSPSTGIFDYWQDSWMSGVATTGYVNLQLTEDDGLPVDISSTWTVPWIDIYVYTQL